MEQLERLLLPAEAAELLGVTPATLEKWRQFGRGPAFIKLSKGRGGHVRYAPSAVARYVAENSHGSTTSGNQDEPERLTHGVLTRKPAA